MNGRANLYVEKCPALIISNLVSPGNSGGPVLTRDGHCVGMTINWLEGEHLEGGKIERMRFAAALPAQLLREAIVELAQSVVSIMDRKCILRNGTARAFFGLWT